MEAQNKRTETLSTIKFDRQTAVKMDRIALKLGRSKRLVFSQMVEYFHRSKKDPLDVNDELLKNTLLKQHKDYIGFIRTQENDLLIPIKREVDRMTRSQKNIVDFFNGQQKHNKVVLEVDRDMLAGQKGLTDIVKMALGSLDGISASLATKESLKEQFRYILETYIRTRDSFGMMTSAKEKDELVRSTRKQIDLL
ncbi:MULTISPECIES: BfmA/BtgA family mobilization protein [Sphingobacterium]|uniref:BfmA/BtgA family mobilization protein n=1 Tax=Sphingobacterium TaxID=28453 RepID=UPI00257E6678|nr:MULTISPECIES: BfmA/BtgA family mobilization protein [Sphingobacterium]